MTVLTTAKAWRRPLAPRVDREPDLSDAERANVRAALRFLRLRVGGSAQLAAALKVTRKSVEKACARNGKPGAGLAIRVARVAKVPLESVLAGEFPVAGACPHCGRT